MNINTHETDARILTIVVRANFNCTLLVNVYTIVNLDYLFGWGFSQLHPLINFYNYNICLVNFHLSMCIDRPNQNKDWVGLGSGQWDS